VGVAFIAPMIPKHANLRTFLSSALLGFNLILEDLTTTGFIKYATFTFIPHIFPNVLLHIKKGLLALSTTYQTVSSMSVPCLVLPKVHFLHWLAG
jgi:hypothetical protein